MEEREAVKTFVLVVATTQLDNIHNQDDIASH